MSPKVLVVGSSGNLGVEICKHLESVGFEVIQSKRKSSGSNLNFATVIPWQEIELPANSCPDAIINLANYYTPSPTPSETLVMKDSILGVATAIANSNNNWQARIITVSTYFQYAPDAFQPWSDYALLKEQANDIQLNHARKFDLPALELILFDNYGGRRKTKFLDLVIESAARESVLIATPGMSLLNLVHIEDLCIAFETALIKLISASNPGIQKFEVRAPLTFTLRELVKEVETATGKDVQVRWGALPYRDREVFIHWNSHRILDDWAPKKNIQNYIYSEYIRLRNISDD